ncbi:polysaccharide lyase family 1 protein [Azospirillum sp. B4]|uniref:pectate lyase family protein n=1 Tax=Azospirillum sp. B4 TaxID=95605 RepID=UPI000346C104|nr:pectate lyase [Azospirillum sp. B4]
MIRRILATTAMATLLALSSVADNSASAAGKADALAFPGAQGWAAHTPGGRGGKIIKVTNLNSEGPGSFREAIETKGPRIIVFEVGGVIDLNQKTIKLEEPFVTIAGQTAPSPGITLIRGGMDVSAHDVVMQHIRIRVGDAGAPKKSGWEEDALSTMGAAYNVIVDHCSLTWATDENLSASGPRFKGDTPEEWRQNTSHRITYSNNIIAEGLARATHYKIEHSKGSLIHDNITDILIVGNLYAHNVERSPLFKGGVHGVIVNNLIYDPGQRAVHYNLQAEEWGDHPYQVGQMAAVGNVLRAGPSTPTPLAFLEIGGYGDLEYYGKDNIAVDRAGEPLPLMGRYTTSPAKVIEMAKAPLWPEGLEPISAAEVQKSVLHNAGARPWDRDYDDVRLLADVAEGRGEIINSQDDVHGYPNEKPTSRPFNPADWNLDDMTPRTATALDAKSKARGT